MRGTVHVSVNVWTIWARLQAWPIDINHVDLSFQTFAFVKPHVYDGTMSRLH